MTGYRTAQKDARVEHCGSYSAWLMKEDGDRDAARWFQPSSRRYFTIDFDDRVILYSHSELDKYIADPIPFKEILWASLATVEPGAAKQHRPVFVVETCQRRTRLVAESEDDAKLWVDALNAARLIGQQADSICKVGLFRASWGAAKSPASVASVSTAEGSVSSSSSRSSARISRESESRSNRCPRQSFPFAASHSDGCMWGMDQVAQKHCRESPRPFGGDCLGNDEDDPDILDVLIKELQDDVAECPHASVPLDQLSAPGTAPRAVSLSRCDSPWLNTSCDAPALDLDVLDVLLHSLDANPTSSPSSSAPDRAGEMWAAPGWLHQSSTMCDRLS